MYGYAIYYLEIQNGLEDPSYQAIVKKMGKRTLLEPFKSLVCWIFDRKFDHTAP
jgi:hypothetical protein